MPASTDPHGRAIVRVLPLLLAIGCGAGSAASPGLAEDAGGGNTQSNASGGAGSDGGVTVTSVTGLPCDVAALLETKCVVCHSSPPTGGAPMSLATYADLTAPALSNPSVSRAQMSLTRMQSTIAPMPPIGTAPATAQEIASFQAWMTAGMPQGTCVGLDAGLGISPYATPVQCTSGSMWTGGTDGSRNMKPGGACIACHTMSGGEGPIFSIAGTVYQTAHEPNDCNGAGTSGASVVITDANNQVLTLTVNRAGNFYSSQPVALPFHAKVVAGGKERAMSAAQSSGDCNTCHTETGSVNAPGRIMLP